MTGGGIHGWDVGEGGKRREKEKGRRREEREKGKRKNVLFKH